MVAKSDVGYDLWIVPSSSDQCADLSVRETKDLSLRLKIGLSVIVGSHHNLCEQLGTFVVKDHLAHVVHESTDKCILGDCRKAPFGDKLGSDSRRHGVRPEHLLRDPKALVDTACG